MGASYHKEHPYVLSATGEHMTVAYQPAESDSGFFGGNSNWRGPIWFPVNYLIVDALREFHTYYGDNFKVECPTGPGRYLSLAEIADELAARLVSIFLRDPALAGRRPVYGGLAAFQADNRWGNFILFHEYFHGDNGAGLGANHQTGWTGLVAELIQERGRQRGQRNVPADSQYIGHEQADPEVFPQVAI
jgi:hypothetical protein